MERVGLVASSDVPVLILGEMGTGKEVDQGAAALLDINPHTLRARMRKMGIEWSRFRSK